MCLTFELSNLLADGRNHLVQIADDGVLGFGDDRGFGVGVDGDDGVARLETGL